MFSLLFTVKGRIAIFFVCCASGAENVAISKTIPRAIRIVFFILFLLAGFVHRPRFFSIEFRMIQGSFV